MIYIYGLVDPRDGALRYVGKTKNPTHRLWHHPTVAKSGKRDDHKDRWIRSVLESGAKPTVTVLIETDDAHWQEDERFIIAGFRAAGYRLTNTAAGGEGVDVPHTAEWHAKIGMAHRGKVLSPEQCEAMSRASRERVGNFCKHGHEFTEENTYWATGKNKRPYRSCRQCQRISDERARRAKGKVPRSEWVPPRGFKGHTAPRLAECIRGHLLTGDNLRILVRKHQGSQYEEHICRECVRIRNRAAKQRRRQKGKA